jgi:hypothetical protein
MSDEDILGPLIGKQYGVSSKEKTVLLTPYSILLTLNGSDYISRNI